MKRPPVPRLIQRLVLATSSIIVALVGVEVMLRLADYRPALSSEYLVGNPVRMADPNLVIVDSHFLSDAFYGPYRVSEGTRLVVALGDSFTESFPVDREHTYPTVPEDLLSEAGWDVRVMNAGMGDTGPDQHLLMFETLILPRVTPAVVVWQFYPNDSYDNAIKPLFDVTDVNTLTPTDVRDNWLYRRQRFVEAVPLPAFVKRHSYLFHLMLRRYETALEAQVPQGRDPSEWGRQKIRLAVERMNALGKQHRFEVYYTLVVPESMYRDDIVSGGTLEFEYPRLLSILASQPGFINTRFERENADTPSSFAATDLLARGERDPSPLGWRAPRHWSSCYESAQDT